MKLLLSCTPFGSCEFVSDAYFCRIDDAALTEACGVLEDMTEGSALCADKGFLLAALLMKKRCGIVQPVEKPKNKRFSRKALLYSARVSRVRIHVERWVRRLKERSVFLQRIVPSGHIHLVYPVAMICGFMANFRKPVRGGK